VVLDLDKEQKEALNVQNLLSMFHKYEDQILVAGGENGV
jgi:ABC-type uncharacterized transport system ATPase component